MLAHGARDGARVKDVRLVVRFSMSMSMLLGVVLVDQHLFKVTLEGTSRDGLVGEMADYLLRALDVP